MSAITLCFPSCAFKYRFPRGEEFGMGMAVEGDQATALAAADTRRSCEENSPEWAADIEARMWATFEPKHGRSANQQFERLS